MLYENLSCQNWVKQYVIKISWSKVCRIYLLLQPIRRWKYSIYNRGLSLSLRMGIPLRGFMISTLSYCCPEMLWSPLGCGLSTTILAENQLVNRALRLGSYVPPLLSSTSYLISNKGLFRIRCLTGFWTRLQYKNTVNISLLAQIFSDFILLGNLDIFESYCIICMWSDPSEKQYRSELL